MRGALAIKSGISGIRPRGHLPARANTDARSYHHRRMSAAVAEPEAENMTERTLTTWMCLICGWIYDEAAGLPDAGIAPGTRGADLPPNWVGPECGARKEDFEMAQV
jgi:rubredoxin